MPHIGLHHTKRHFVKNLCNGMKKPMGSRGVKDNCINTCIAIERSIMDKMHASMLGISLEDGNNKDSSDDVAEEDEDVKENGAVEENTAYRDRNVDANAVSLLEEEQNNYDWLRLRLKPLMRCLREMLMERWLKVMLLLFLTLLEPLESQR